MRWTVFLASYLASVLVAPAAYAQADSVPVFDTTIVCKVAAQSAGAVADCQRREDAARADLELRWDSYAKQRRHFCSQSVKFLKREERSYVALTKCIMDAKTS